MSKKKTLEAMVKLGDCRELLRKLPDAIIDAIVTDPPYELGFMGKKWDASGIAYNVDLWRECLRVLKPGGYLLSFGGTRTSHRMACAIEDAGFEVRDSIHWIYGSGFPKSLDVSKAIDKAAGAERKRIKGARSGGMAAFNKGNAEQGYRDSAYYEDGNELLSKEPVTDAARQWQGWGTALKPAHEPIVVARKPLDGTVAANVLAHGTGAINVDGCRVGTTDSLNGGAYSKGGRAALPGDERKGAAAGMFAEGAGRLCGQFAQPDGRWPPNILLTHAEDCGDECAEGCPVAEMDRQSGVSKSTGGRIGNASGCYTNLGSTGWNGNHQKGDPGYGDSGGASRFFPIFYYGAKANRRERDHGCESLPSKSGSEAVERKEGSAGTKSPSAGAGRTASEVKNHHPTTKPLSLMRWLVKLVTAPNGLVLDPFTGSGTTGAACVLEGFRFLGFEQSAEYVAIAQARIQAAEADARNR